ncbi:hypothetical protein SADUNF_Sadunf08G0159000 [Salix dunnii]|uniref:Uncharacterized protein n=1 Tax=Salix dunnii TaxID=1413687 RepID=A0A835MV58_9ROSI|nr:hypothetical protein SADUNF_Sadunf08G0159000 [Salix dunnii]
MVQIRISSSKLTLVKTHLVGNEGSNVPVKDGLKLPIVIKTFQNILKRSNHNMGRSNNLKTRCHYLLKMQKRLTLDQKGF